MCFCVALFGGFAVPFDGFGVLFCAVCGFSTLEHFFWSRLRGGLGGLGVAEEGFEVVDEDCFDGVVFDCAPVYAREGEFERKGQSTGFIPTSPSPVHDGMREYFGKFHTSGNAFAINEI